MDSGVGTPPEVNSYDADILRSPSSGRKRKLQLEHLVPISKHKSRHHLDPDESSGDNMDDESETALGFHLGPEQTDGSSSSTTTLWELQDHAEMSPKVFVPRFEYGGFRDRHDSLDSRVAKNSKNASCQLPALDAIHGVDEPDCQSPVSGVDEGGDEFIEEEEKESAYATAQELMLSCCEDVGLHTLGLSSAKWNIKQDALHGTVRPTIDKEFEEYFSMLML